MRITSFTLLNEIVSSFRESQRGYEVLTRRLGTQKRLLAPSDDAMGARRALDYRVDINANGQNLRNIDGAVTNLKLSDTVLSAVHSAVSQIRSLVDASRGGTSDPAAQANNAEQAGLLRDQLSYLANTKGADGYLFSGFRTDQKPYAAGTFAYQGDGGVVNVPIGGNDVMAANVPGSDVFSLKLDAPYVTTIEGGLNVHYTPGAGTTVDVEIRDAADTAVLDTFSFSNGMQMADLLSTAAGANDAARIQALADPFLKLQDQVAAVQADVGARIGALSDQASRLDEQTLDLKNALSSIEDADLNETAAQLQQASVSLQALYAASARILNQSLFDFLK